jgi:hypothetical protein
MASVQLAGLLFALLGLAAAVFQFCVLCGASWGELTMGGRWPGRVPVPGRIAAALSCVVLLAMTLIVASASGLLSFSLPRVAAWAVCGLMAASVVAHLFTPSAAERRVWLPVVGLMFLASLCVATMQGG